VAWGAKMKRAEILLTERKIRRSDVPAVILAIVGPLLGLAYILFFPVVGLASCILAGCYRVGRSLAAMWHRATQATVDVR